MPEIDRDALDAQTGGDAELGAEVLLIFAGECARLLPALRDPAAPGPARADIAHTIRGAAAGIGAGRVHALAGTAETGLRAGAPEAEAACTALVAAIEVALAEIAAGR
jgi:HPt (histidine-containing phosphotransfer) domain-containing protein